MMIYVEGRLRLLLIASVYGTAWNPERYTREARVAALPLAAVVPLPSGSAAPRGSWSMICTRDRASLQHFDWLGVKIFEGISNFLGPDMVAPVILDFDWLMGFEKGI